MVLMFVFGVATFEADCPGVPTPGTLPPILLTDFLASLLLDFMMVFEAPLTPGVAFFPPFATFDLAFGA